MAISANSVHEIRADATAGNVNGGFFVTGATGTDFSQQAAAQYANLAVTSAGATATLDTASAAAVMVGNGLKVVSGTNATVSWYEIISVVVGVSITVDRNWCSGACADGVVNIGGAHSLGAANDDAMFEISTAGNIWYLRGASGTLTTGAAISLTAAGTNSAPIKIIGYASTRGDNPTGATRPLVNTATASITLGVSWWVSYVSFTSTSSIVLGAGNGNVFWHVKAVNTSSTAARSAFNNAGANCSYYMCEGVSLRGYAFISATVVQCLFCTFHDSDMGVRTTSTLNSDTYSGCIFSNNVTAAFTAASGMSVLRTITDCTFYGSEVPRGIGIDMITGNTFTRILNCIFYGFVTGVNHADAANPAYAAHNNFFNNTTNRTNFMTGANDTALDPKFSRASQVTGTTAITVAANILRDTGKNFITEGVLSTDCYLHVISGTGVTAGKYLITNVAATELTVTPAITADATADKVYSITVGKNFATGSAMQGIGAPSTFPGGYTESNDSIGATTAEGGAGFPTYAI